MGTVGWSYSFWKGSFYPLDLASKDFLAHYASRFDTVEVDSTFYRIPRASTVSEWKQQTPNGFLFSLIAKKKPASSLNAPVCWKKNLAFCCCSFRPCSGNSIFRF